MSGQITLISASAGSGKTYRLGTALLDAVNAGTPPQFVLATTFTNRAAAELLARGRNRLLQGGFRASALNLMLARVGTVNAVFGRVLADFALQNGRSPVVSVIPDTAQAAVFRVAADACIHQHAPTLAALAERFEFFVAGADWHTMLTELVAIARANGLAPDDLDGSASRSISSVLAALPNQSASPATALDAALLEVTKHAVANIRSSGDATKMTRDALDVLEQAAGRLERGTASWGDWARLSKLHAAKASDHCLVPVRDTAARHAEHPRLHEDIETFVRTMFTAAAQSMVQVQKFKRTQGLVDFVDQEADALDLLADPIASRRIADETKLLLVDEFQDTSPIQLALFLRLSALVEETIFVGDTKQAIYGFRGADPNLVDAVASSLTRRGDAKNETLPTNRRSRPAIVHFVNAVFGTALPPLGIPQDQVVTTPHRTDNQVQPSALALWRVHGRNKEIACRALAQRVARVLEERGSWSVQPHGEPTLRPVRGGDIAILVRTNDNASEVADALAAAGLRVALARNGLLSRAECVVAMAGLRFIADDSDTLALAEIAHALEGAVAAPAWLSTALTSSDTSAALRGAPFAMALAAERPSSDALTPSETLDRAISVLDVRGLLLSWGDPSARHANLASLRALAVEYEAECQRGHLPATASGLVAWLTAQTQAEQPASPDPEAIQVLTCHGAKGLEWPMVILADLDNPGEARLFNKPVAMPNDAGLDTEDPLGGRWIRLWPWPYGRQKSGIGLDTTAPTTPEGHAANTAAKAEAARLLYVAMTRARDFLVLAPRLLVPKTGPTVSASWLDLLPGTPRPLVLPAAGDVVSAAGQPIAAVVEDLVAAEAEAAPPPAAFRGDAPVGPPPMFAPRRLVPSTAAGGSMPGWRVISIGDRLPLQGAPDMTALGEALHGFFAADRPTADLRWRTALAERLLASWGVSALRAGDAVVAADRIWRHVEAEHPGGICRREWPVTQVARGQVLSGRIDLVIEQPKSLAIYDHKSFPGGRDRWAAEVAADAPQLRMYGEALEAASGLPVSRLAIHLPIAGAVLILEA